MDYFGWIYIIFLKKGYNYLKGIVEFVVVVKGCKIIEIWIKRNWVRSILFRDGRGLLNRVNSGIFWGISYGG